MADAAITNLHLVNSGILDVLQGHETLKKRGKPVIMAVASELEDLHRRHQAEIAARLRAHGEATDDGTVRGAVNKVATTLRDWIGSLDGDALSFVRMGEELCLKNYDMALSNWDEGTAPEDRRIVARQAQELRNHALQKPKAA